MISFLPPNKPVNKLRLKIFVAEAAAEQKFSPVIPDKLIV